MENETTGKSPQSKSDELEQRLNETKIWLRIIKHSELLKPNLLTGMVEENQELCRIFTSSLKTARTRKK
jgi:hypothetical protein